MGSIPVPYARERAYDDDGYVTRMSDLMMRRSAMEQEAMRQQGAISAARWSGAGNVITTTLADIAKQRDYRKQLELRASEREQERADMLAQRGIDNQYRADTLAATNSEREEARKYREQQDRFNRARESADDVMPYAELSPEDYAAYDGTPSARRFRRNAPMDARLPATSMIDTAGMAGYGDAMNAPVQSARESAGEQPFDYAEASSMSPDSAARPESFTRLPNGQEQLAIQNAAAQERARREAEANRIRDDKESLRKFNATEAAAARRHRETMNNRPPTTASLALAAAGGDENARKALAIIQKTEGTSPTQVTNFMRISGEWQKSPLSSAADRTSVLSASVNAVRADPQNASEQFLLGYAFIQAADTYMSAVRESEIRGLGGLGTHWMQLKQKVENIVTTGATMPPEVTKQITDTAARLVQTINDAAHVKAQDFGRRSKVAGIGDMWDAYYQPPTPAKPPAKDPFWDKK